MRRFSSENRTHLGFTLMEALVTVGIIVLVAAIAIPSIISIRTNLKINELDSTARLVFVAAQNRISMMKSSGELEMLDGVPITVSPSDFEESGLEAGTELYYAEQGSATARLLLPEGSVDETVRSTAGKYVIEFEPLTGSIYGVFFTDSPEGFSYTSDTSPARSREQRKNEKPYVGYYGGAGIGSLEQTDGEEPQLSLVNGETLYLTLTPRNMCEYTVHVASTEYPELYKIFVFDFDDGDSVTSLNRNISYDADTGSYQLLLDSLEYEFHFADIFSVSDGDDESPITPGDNLAVTVTESYYGGEAVVRPSAVTIEANSLFESRVGDEVTVSCARHLQNLEQKVSNLGLYVRSASVLKTSPAVSSVVQTAEIDWSVRALETVTGFVGSPLISAKQGEFVPIVNLSLSSFDGAGLGISNLNVGVNEIYSALLGYGENLSIENVLLENPLVDADNARYAGALVGLLSGGSVSDSGVYVSDTEGLDKYGVSAVADVGSLVQSVGGLAGGLTSVSVERCFASLPSMDVTTAATSSSTVGGLVGAATSCDFLNSFAAIGVAQTSEEDVNFYNDSISVTAVGELFAGGLVGVCDGSGSVSDCYTACNLSISGGTGAGVVGKASGTEFSDCYSATLFEGSADDVATYGFASSVGAANSYTAPCCFIKSSVPAREDVPQVAELSYAELRSCVSGDSWTSATEETTHPIARIGRYPFPRITALEHYGDWPGEVTEISADLAYYEQYSDGTFGFFASGFEIAPVLSNAKTVISDGYAFLLSKETYDRLSDKHFAVGYNSFFSQTLSAVALDGELLIAAVNGEDCCIYPITPDSDAVTLGLPAVADSFYHELTVGEQIFYFNPFFASTAVNGELAVPDDPEGIIVRTARHVSRLSALPEFWSKSFTQQRSVDAASYSAVPLSFAPIGASDASNTPFSGSYDGGSFTITGFGLTGTELTNVGLFGVTSAQATLSNIFFVSDFSATVARTIDGAEYVGALVGYNNGTVTNCSAAGFELSGNYVGGLVGYNAGTISRSSADSAYFTAGVSLGGSISSTGHSGGFVARNDGTISDCYALAKTAASNQAGGFVGQNSGSISYSYCLAIDTNDEYVDFGANGEKINTCYSVAAVSNASKNQISFINLKELSKDLGAQRGWANITAAGRSFSYFNKSVAGCFPFPAIVTTADGLRVHYGNWPTDDLDTVEMAYYEIYSETDGTYSMKLYNDTLGLDELDDDKTIICDGYVLLFEKDRNAQTSGGISYTNLTSPSIVSHEWLRKNRVTTNNYLKKPTEMTYNSNSITVRYKGNALSATNGSNTLTIGGAQYYPRFLASGNVVADDSVQASYYQYVKIKASVVEYGQTVKKERTFWYNPHFAKSIISIGERPSNEDGTVALPEKVIIRTERQYATLATSSINGSMWKGGYNFIQERNLIFGDNNPYTNNYITTVMEDTYRNKTNSIGSYNSSFNGVYDGKGHSITGLTITPGTVTSGNSPYYGMFGYATDAAVKNLTLIDANINAVQNKNIIYIGTLIGCAANVKVENVTVKNPTVYGDFLVGGMFGKLYGRSTVKNVTVDGGSVTAARQVGGFAGRISNEPGSGSLKGLTINGVTIKGSLLARSSEDIEYAVIDTDENRMGGYGTAAFVGVCALSEKYGNISISNINVSSSNVVVEEMKNTAALVNDPSEHYHAGGLLFGNLFGTSEKAALNLSGITLVNSVIEANGSGEKSHYGIISGAVHSLTELSIPPVTNSGCEIARAEATDREGTNIGGYFGTVTGIYSNSYDNKISATNRLRFSVSYGSVRLVTLSGLSATTGTNIGGFVGRVGEYVVFETNSKTKALTVSQPVIVGDGGNTGGFVGVTSGSIVNMSVDRPIISDIKGGNVGGFAGLLSGGETSRCDVRMSSLVKSVSEGESVPYQITGTGNVGGFVGEAHGAEAVAASCFAAVPVSGGNRVGGFVGLMSSSRIESCYASGTVTGVAGGNTGGFVGRSEAAVDGDVRPIPLLSTCYASGTVNGSELNNGYTGGFMGYSASCSLLSCYSLGSVTVNGAAGETNQTGGFIGYGEGLEWNPDQTVTPAKVLANMATFYNVLQTTKVINRYDSQPTLNEDGTLDYTNCRNVLTYLRDSEIKVDSMVRGTMVDGLKNSDGIIEKSGNSGAISKNVLDRMENYSELKVGTWTAQWSDAEQDVVVYWCTSSITLSDVGKTVDAYRYISKKNQYSIGTMKVGKNTNFGGVYPHLMIENSSFDAMPQPMPGTSAINGCYLFAESTLFNCRDDSYLPTSPYSDYNFEGISRWVASSFISDAALTASTQNTSKVFNNMSVTKNSYPYSDALTYYPYPALTAAGSAISAAVHWGDWPSCIPLSGVAYYEKYSDGSSATFVKGVEGEIDSLNNELAVVESGYALFRQSGSGISMPTSRRSDISMSGYEFFRLPYSNRVFGLSFCEVNGTGYIYNTDFAKAIELRYDRLNSTLGTLTPYLIRTPKQFSAINLLSTGDTGSTDNYYLDMSFVQNRSFDAQGTDISVGDFSGQYNGFGFNISGVTASAPGEARTGLFETNLGVVRNINLSITITAPYAASNAIVGGLIGVNEGSVSNCSVVTAVDSEAVGAVIGGIVGLNNGNINLSSSEVAFTVENASHVGGFVGINGVEAATSQSYSKGTMSGSASYSGGFAGETRGRVENCYAAVVNSILATGEGARAQFAALIPSGKVLDCYAWDMETYGSVFVASAAQEALIENCYYYNGVPRDPLATETDATPTDDPDGVTGTETLLAADLNAPESSIWKDVADLPRPILTYKLELDDDSGDEPGGES